MKSLWKTIKFTGTIQIFTGSASLVMLMFVFLKAGLVFYGGGFALIPVLSHQLVSGRGWLTPGEFLDGVAISTLTPGPIAVISTFVGYKIYGIMGAIVATTALFLPAMTLMYFASRIYRRVKDVQIVQVFLDSVLPAVVSLIAVAAVRLGANAIRNYWSGLVAAVSLLLLIRFKVNPAWLLLTMAIAGWVLKLQ